MSYWQKPTGHSYWKPRLGLRGLGVDNVTCDPGEVFDLTAMMCVQAGSATTPITPNLPSVPSVTPTFVPGAPTSTPPTTIAKTQQASVMGAGSGSLLPWILGGAAVVAAVYFARGT